jgi:hypothetical protein
MMQPPSTIENFAVIEYGFLPHAVLPAGYLPPRDGGHVLEPMQNFAICMAEGVDGYYLLCCTADWRYMTYSFGEDMDEVKSRLRVELDSEVKQWYPFPGK